MTERSVFVWSSDSWVNVYILQDVLYLDLGDLGTYRYILYFFSYIQMYLSLVQTANWLKCGSVCKQNFVDHRSACINSTDIEKSIEKSRLL